MQLDKKIEAILFWKGESVSINNLADILHVSTNDVMNALENLRSSLAGRGVVLIENDGEVMLATAPEFGDILENLQKEELNKTLSKSALETLSVVLYKNGVSRAEIDYIRGVNSSFTLRALSVRGLVKKETDPNDSRRYIYKPTFELLSYMGIKSVEELPEFESTNIALKSAEESLRNIDNENQTTDEIR